MLAVRLLIVLLFLCAPALADVVPSPIPSAAVVQPGAQAMPPPVDQLRADMERRAAQLRESQLSLRRTLLGLLSPTQRELVAATIGELAIAPDPDVAAATRRIDAALSPAQREAVFRLVAAEAARRQAMFMDMIAQSQRDMAPQVPPLAAQLPSGAGSPHSSGIAMQVGSGIAMSGPGMLALAPGQSAGATLLMLLMSPGASAVQPVPVIIKSGPVSGSGP